MCLGTKDNTASIDNDDQDEGEETRWVKEKTWLRHIREWAGITSLEQLFCLAKDKEE